MSKKQSKREKNKIVTLLEILKKRDGVTLIELIVTFALISIFVACICQLLPSALKVYNNMRNMQYGHQVANTIMEKIAGEIEGAQVGVVRGEGTEWYTDQR